MKNYIFRLTLLFLLISQAQAQIGGGSDASGGGEYLRTKVRMGKSLAILTLSTLDETKLNSLDLNSTQFEFYIQNRLNLVQDLNNSPLIFREAHQRNTFILGGEEKTALTKHLPSFPIEINVARCEELQMTEFGAAVLMIREGARHLGIHDDHLLSEIENIGTIVIGKFLLNHSSFLIENSKTLSYASQKPSPLVIPYSDVQSDNGEITYLFEDLFHYYLAGNFDTEMAELILASFRKTEEFLENIGFPVYFEYRGEYKEFSVFDLPRIVPQSPLKNAFKDTNNVIYKMAFQGYERSIQAKLQEEHIQTVHSNFDILLNTALQTHNYTLNYYGDNFYFPCMCEIISKSIFKILSLNKVFPWLEENSAPAHPETQHHHFDFFDQFSALQIQAMKEYLQTRVVVVQKPKATPIYDHADFSLYATEMGLLIQFKPSLLYSIREEDLSVAIFKKETFLTFDGLSKDTLIAHGDIDSFNGSSWQGPSNGILFKIPSASHNPLLAHLTAGRLKVFSMTEDITHAQTPIVIYLYDGSNKFSPFLSLPEPFRHYELDLPKMN